jgi:hypothetical protein
MNPGLKVVEGEMSLRIAQIPRIDRSDIKATDLYVAEVEGGSNGDGFGIWWSAVIYRPESNELFKIRCSDGENGGYQPEISGGSIPNCRLEVH